MLINFSNHPYLTWTPEQKAAAQDAYGEVADLPFPPVDASASLDDVDILASRCVEQIISLSDQAGAEGTTVHISGEYTLVYRVLDMLKSSGIPAVVATSHRKVKINPDGSKTLYFDFIRFREYY